MVSFHRRMNADDLFSVTHIQNDPFTVTFNPRFYNTYLSRFAEQCYVYSSATGGSKGYMIAKDEGYAEKGEYHVHISAVTVAPEYRRQGVSRSLIDRLENDIGRAFNCTFCDLFVKATNSTAISVYQNLNYVVYRTIKKYYDKEDGLDMRHSLFADPTCASERTPKGQAVINKWVDYPL
ncbi:Acetyltransferase [Giardia duodenalis]|uniref:N-terminal acetyltransferase complex ARD1 subunit, putative n=2 Tax=Giardia intestinalis TaxID=5741 RepID=C6LWE0_GIAIB|nr:N-terminal acetyltransferase complex ARD1 subunit, putative [Giardia intestinalis ATCC 50581]ESU42229.1 Acetyltransferase [Giardia intestinalis]